MIRNLIENAVACFEKKWTFEEFVDYNKETLEHVEATAEEVWEIADYIYNTYRHSIIWDIMENMEKRLSKC